MESTNRVPIDADQNVPRIIKRGSTTITTSTVPATGWVKGTATITLSDISSSANTSVDVVVKDNQTNFVYFSPLQSITASEGFGITIAHYLTATSSKLTVNIDIRKKAGSASDTYTAYYIVYSTSISTAISL